MMSEEVDVFGDDEELRCHFKWQGEKEFVCRRRRKEDVGV
jgi:hypothetical protein